MKNNFYISSICVFFILNIILILKIIEAKRQKNICKYKKQIILCAILALLYIIAIFAYIVDTIIRKDSTNIVYIFKMIIGLSIIFSCLLTLYRKS